jgi:hypothetical protein
MGVTKFRTRGTTEAGGDPLREALAAALQASKAAHAAVAKQRQAVTRLWAEQLEADESIEKLEKAVAKAEAAYLDGLAAAAANEEPAPASGVPAARAAVEVATDHRDALRAARKKVEAELPRWQADATSALTEADRLISEILAPIAERLLVRAQKMVEELAPLRATLSALSLEMIPAGFEAALAHEKGRRPLAETRETVATFLRDTNVIERARPDPWTEARQILRENPHADLPAALTALLG